MSEEKKELSYDQKLKKIEEDLGVLSAKANLYRGRSITVGPAGNGVIEISIRADGATVWYQMYPVEAVEFLEQMAAACGLYVATRPKNDFASWRDWKETNLEDYSWRGANLHNNMHDKVGVRLFKNLEEQKVLPEKTLKENIETNE